VTGRKWVDQYVIGGLAALGALALLVGVVTTIDQEDEPAESVTIEEEFEPNYTPEPEPTEPAPTFDTAIVEQQIESQLPVSHGFELSVTCPRYTTWPPPVVNCTAHDVVTNDLWYITVEVAADGTWTWGQS
jgi:hypothetical protein